MSAAPAWLQGLLEDPQVTDLCLNGFKGAFVDRGQGMESVATETSTGATWNEEVLRGWVLEQVSRAGKTWDAKHPFVDASLPSGHRLHVAFPPMSTEGILVSLRRLPQAASDGSSCARWSTSSDAFRLLANAAAAGDSILVAGSTGSGKTTLATDLIGHIPKTQRIIALEDTAEIMPAHPHFVRLLSRPPNADGFGEVTLRALLKQALRMRPDRIVLGECRGPEVLELLQALNTGHGGSLATLHANSPRDALRRLELLCLLASSGSIPLHALRDLLASGLQWVAQVKRLPEGRRITEIWKVEGREGDTILMRPYFQR